MLYATVTSYFAELDTISEITEKTQNVINHRLPSTGRFIFSLSVDKFFGIPRSVSAKGLEMDMDRVFHYSLEKSGDKEKTRQFNLTIGMNSSALEHSVPEQLFSTTANPAEAVSAVKALAIANSPGIPIYQINQANISSVLPNLQLDPDTIYDIQNAVNAGKEVTVSQTNINFNGWNGCGYLIIDPETGAGAYMISGGSSGAMVIIAITFSILILLAALAVPGSVTFLGPLMYAASGSFMEQFGVIAVFLGVSAFGVWYATSDPFYDWINEYWEEYIESTLVDIVDYLPGVPQWLKALLRILTGNPGQ